MMQAKQEHQHKNGWQPVLRRLGLSLMAGLALFAGLLAIAAAVCLKLDAALTALPLIAIPIAGLSAFAAAYCNVRPVRKQGLLLGLLAAGAFYLITLTAALAFSRATLGMNAVTLLLVALFCGGGGGVFAANRVSSAKSVRRKKPRR
ncbi:MAG: TIGR04086 family membrane protein [Oscillospiraceae bacterium]|jgi:putative membrane protein (TIGR04086 family)|nr:TIGR04086 family membrane protein [Oscillospiraceae bacterium]